MPDTPQQEAAFLAFPDTCQQIFILQRFAAVLPGILVFVQVIGYDVEDDSKNGEDRDTFNGKRNTGKASPVAAVFIQLWPVAG